MINNPFAARKAEVIIGIDPDCDKSGYARLDKVNNTLTLGYYTFVELIRQLIKDRDECKEREWVVIVEAGYLETRTQHHYSGDNPRVAARVGQKVGRNHETARKILELCEGLDLPCQEGKPLVKIWGKSHKDKISAMEFNALTGYTKRTNQEVRDAALLAWVAAGRSTNLDMRK